MAMMAIPFPLFRAKCFITSLASFPFPSFLIFHPFLSPTSTQAQPHHESGKSALSQPHTSLSALLPQVKNTRDERKKTPAKENKEI